MLINTVLAEDATTTFWRDYNEHSTESISHVKWQTLLTKHVLAPTDGINRFNYAAVTASDAQLLNSYISDLSSLDPRSYSRAEQKAYWINLYNALTVKLIIDNYPTKSITKLGNKFFSFGPWDDALVNVADKTLTLNDIEHQILRPIFTDNRIHYGVNCASLSCPNLQVKAFTAANTDSLLTAAASDYINHRRAVSFTNGQLQLSSIYKWYKEDFGASTQGLLAHLSEYATPSRAEKIKAYRGKISYHYDWGLNKP